MSFDHLTGEFPSELVRKNMPEPDAIPIVAIGEEIAVAVRCFRNDVPARLPRLRERIRQFSELREGLARAYNTAFGATVKRAMVMIIFTENVVLSDADADEAAASHVTLFDGKDLEYYETLVSHLGPAAKYQLLADTLPGKQIPGLEIRVPAVKTRIGGSNCYTFSMSPEYLLRSRTSRIVQRGRRPMCIHIRGC
jgi:hypothetical protein